MRYIDEMLREIPIEELMDVDRPNMDDHGDESLAIIPDVPTRVYRQPAEVRDSYTKNIKEKTIINETKQITPAQANEKEKAKRKKAKIKSHNMGVLAAALALVIGVGAVTAYFGAVKHTGPLASLFYGNGEASKANKELAHKNAKQVFIAVNGCTSDIVADGNSLYFIGPGLHVMDLDNASAAGDSEYEASVRNALKRVGINSGEIAFQISEEANIIFAQWRASKGAYVGQYPNPKDGLVFGEFDDMPEFTENDNKLTLPDFETANPWDAANTAAKYVYVQINGYISDCIADAEPIGLDRGKHIITFSDEGMLKEEREFLAKAGLLDKLPEGSELFFYINNQNNISIVQWRMSEGSYVGQYPDPRDGRVFGHMALYSDDCIAEVTVSKKTFWEESFYELYTTNIHVEDLLFLDNAVLVDESELGAELFGMKASVNISNPPAQYGEEPIRFETSDRVGADIKIKDRYYKCGENMVDYLERRFYAGSRQAYLTSKDGYEDNWFCADQDDFEKWYSSFIEENLTPVSDPGEEIETDEMFYATFWYVDKPIEVANTKYKNANLQVNGKYYNAKDISVLNIIRILSQRSTTDEYDLDHGSSYYHVGFKEHTAQYPSYSESFMDTELLYGYDDILNAEKTLIGNMDLKSAETYGISCEAVLVQESTGMMMLVSNSDHPEADVIINGRYYKCEMARELMKDIMRKTPPVYRLNRRTVCSSDFNTERIEKWYNDIMASRPKPLSRVTWKANSINEVGVSFMVGDEPVSICTVNFDDANIIINNRYYLIENVKEFSDIVREITANKG